MFIPFILAIVHQVGTLIVSWLFLDKISWAQRGDRICWISTTLWPSWDLNSGGLTPGSGLIPTSLPCFCLISLNESGLRCHAALWHIVGKGFSSAPRARGWRFNVEDCSHGGGRAEEGAFCQWSHSLPCTPPFRGHPCQCVLPKASG